MDIELRQQSKLISMWKWTSWEEQAFVDDQSNAMITGLPARCYTCTFCGRMFRSAQALGGHMNVHRRDRAKLLQYSQRPENLQAQGGNNGDHDAQINECVSNGAVVDELDLELRLGR
ncbi:hypothetical protein J5N97_029476 [Dioscorea zingiberensis]|uniref:C2H2-type domain-containing protein n=1 Tax=Dioscorea zingiberensis TaxID=325984 RepID=A0A9D5H5P0_9LILI|nr:hypothetical protein J5N97_029476 [Dioscorea zingiberensis]